MVQKERLSITLEPEVLNLVKRLAKFEKKPTASVISAIIKDFEPVMRQMVELMEKAENLSAEKRAELARIAAAAEPDLMATAAALQTKFNETVSQSSKALDD